MKYSKIIFILIIVLFTSISYSQKVVDRMDDYILININESSGYKVNHIIKIYRSVNDTTKSIGEAQILEYRDDKCALKVISEDPKIDIGDFVKPTENAMIDKLYNSYYSKMNISEPKRSRIITYMAAGAGVIASGLGYTFYHKTSQIYDDYKKADTADDAVSLYRDAERYNDLSKISFGIGGGLFAFALINEFIVPLTTKNQHITVNPNFLNNSLSVAINF